MSFTLNNIGSYAPEGVTFSFDVTPDPVFLVARTIRWEIIFRGDIPAFSSDFISMSGDLDFVSGATVSQTITLSITDDNSYEVDREFVIRVWDTHNTADDISDDTQIGEDAVVILQDDDTNSFTNSVNAFTSSRDNTFTAASSIFLNFVSASGDDSFIITRFQYGDVRINDIAGSSYIKFDRGVTIEAINEEAVSFGGLDVTSVDLILSTGSTITIEAPTKPEFQYQLGDSRVLDYGDFISTLGTVSASLPYVVTGSSTVATPDDGFRNVIGLYRTVGDDIMGLGSDFDLNVTGGLGDDSFIITRFQTGDVSIKDVAGSSYIKFDRGVTIVSVYETVFDLGVRDVTSVDLILSTGSTISIDAPTKLAFQYQFGDGVLLNYEDFASALSSVVVSVAGDVSSDRYVVGGVIFGAGPYRYSVSENLDASGVGNAMVLGSISVTVTSGGTLNYAFDGGTLTDSLGHFAITSVGEISYIGSGLDRETTSVHYLKVHATSSDGSVDVANISIEVNNVNEVPVLLSMIGSQTVTIGVDLDVSSFFEDGDVASSGDELTYTAMRVDSGGVNPRALPSGLSINADTGIFSASSSVVGVTYQVEVTATDSGGLSVVSNVFALYVNTAPIVSNSIDDETITLADSHVITIADSNDTTSNVFSDVDGDVLTYTVTFSDGSSLSGGVTFVTSNGDATLVFADTVVAGVYNFIITATDTHNVSVTESFSVTVNTPPQFSSTSAITFTNTDSTVTEDDFTDDRVSGALSFSDVDDTLANLSLHATSDGTPPTASIGLLTFTSGDVSIDGIYGIFTFMRDATTSAVTWTYLLDSTDSDTNALDSGAIETESVQLLVRDDGNAVSSVVTLSVTVEGSNDAPVAQNPIDNATITLADSHVVTIADSNNTASNVFSDVDTGDSLSYSATLSDGSSLPSGITFGEANGVTQLNFADTVALGVYDFIITAMDTHNVSVTESFSVTVDTAPVVLNSISDVIVAPGVERRITIADSSDTTSNVFSDADTGDTLTYTLQIEDANATTGTFVDTLPSGITWDNTMGDEALIFADTVALGVYNFKLTATDTYNLSVAETFSVTVTTNTAPAFSSPDAITFTNNDFTVTEDDSTNNRVSGALSFNDVDSGDTLASLSLHATNDGTPPTASTGELTFTSDGTDSTASIDGIYGAFTFTRDATTSAVTWTYVLDNADSDTNALDVGATATDSVQLLVRDGENAVSSVETLSIAVEGSSDLMNPIELSIQGSASVMGVTLSGDVDTDLNVIVVKGNNTTVTYSVSDSRFSIDANNNLIAQSGAVFDYTTEPIVSITIKIVVTDANSLVNVKTIDAIVNVVTATGPVFSLGTSSGTITSSDTHSAMINIDENVDIATYIVYTPSAMADASATSSVVYTLGGTDANSFSIDPSSGSVFFEDSPNYESGITYYDFDVIATTNQPTTVSATRQIELFIQDILREATMNLTDSTVSIPEGILPIHIDTIRVLSLIDPEGGTYRFTVGDSRFVLGSNNHLIATVNSVFDFETEPSVVVEITATNTADSNETYQVSTTISITNVYEDPVFSTGMSSGTFVLPNLALNAVIDTDITGWDTRDGTDLEHIARINDNDYYYSLSTKAAKPRDVDGEYIRFSLGGDHTQGSFIYHNVANEDVYSFVEGSTVDFMKDDVSVYSEVIANAGNIVTITAPVDTLFDTARITFSGANQNLLEMRVLGLLDNTNKDYFEIDENIDTTVSVYTASATADALATSAVVYTLGGTDGSDFNIDTSTGEVTFRTSPDYETKTDYVFDVIATTTDSNSVSKSATRHVELFIQDVNESSPVLSAPSISGASSVTEDDTSDNSVSGSLSFSDTDGSDLFARLIIRTTTDGSSPTTTSTPLVFALDSTNNMVATATMTYGTLTFTKLTDTVTFVYALDSNRDVTQALESSETASDIIQLVIEDTFGMLSPVQNIIVVVSGVNDAPVIATPIVDQSLNEGTNLNFTLPSDVFVDVDDLVLIYTATQADTAGSALPSWISFNDTTGNFSGTAPSVTSDTTISIRVTAMDDSSESVYNDFNIVILDVA